MKKFIVAIGQSAVGKTTFVMNQFVGSAPMQLVNEPIPHTIVGNYCFLGDYTTDLRTKGTDRLSYSILPELLDFVEKNQDKHDYFVAEGDRINCERFFTFLKKINVDVTVYTFICDVELSIKRRAESGSDASEQFVRATQTKTLNMQKFAKSLGFEVICKDTRTKVHGWW